MAIIFKETKNIRNKLDEIEERFKEISRMSKEDTDIMASDVFDLKQRVEFLENKVKELQAA